MSTSSDTMVTIITKALTRQDAYNVQKFATKTELSTEIGKVYKLKGSVNAFANLPITGNQDGDVYNIKTAGGTDRDGVAIKAGDNVAYVVDTEDASKSGWDVLGGTTDLSAYATTNYVDDIFELSDAAINAAVAAANPGITLNE